MEFFWTAFDHFRQTSSLVRGRCETIGVLKRKRLMNYKKIFILESIIFLLSICIPFLLSDYESRNVFYKFLLNGSIPLITFIFFLITGILFGMKNLDSKQRSKSIAIISIIIVPSILILIFGSFFFLLMILASFTDYTDRVFYNNADTKETIVVQYFESGIPGNPNCTFILIKDDDLNENLRKYSVLELVEYEYNDFFGDADAILDCGVLPQEIKLDNNIFYLQGC